VDNGAKVINMSLGGYEYSATLKEATDYARSKGAVVVAAAGNDNLSEPLYPAANPGVVGVAATNHLVFYEEDNSTVYSGSWTTEYNDYHYSGGSAKYSTTPNDYVIFTFTGTWVELYSIRNSSSGIASIYIDNSYQVDIDLYSSTTEYFSPVYRKTDLDPGTHTLKVLVTGDKNPSSSDSKVYIDVFGVDEGTNPRADYSNYGSYVDVAAPGSDILSTYFPTDNSYAWLSGTSMATPFVAGTAALIAASYPNHSGDEIARALAETASDLGTTGRDNYYGYGLINTQSGVKSKFATSEETDENIVYTGSWSTISDPAAGDGAFKQSSASASAVFTFTGTSVTWVTKKGPDQGIARVYLDGQDKGTVDLYASTEQWQYLAYSLKNLSPDTHTLRIEVTGTKNASSSDTKVSIDAFDYLITPPYEPTVNFLQPKSGETSAGAVSIKVAISNDETITAVKYAIDSTTTPIAQGLMTPEDGTYDSAEETVTVIWDSRNVRNGSHTIYIQVSDAGATKWSNTSQVVLIDNPVPIASFLEPVAGSFVSGEVTIKILLTDLDTPLEGAQFSIDGTETVNSMSAEDGFFDSSEETATANWDTFSETEGEHIIYARGLDSSGNWGEWTETTVTVDNEPPTGSILINSGETYTNSTTVILALTYSDAGSGIDRVRYSNDGLFDSEVWEDPTLEKAWTLNPGEGEKVVYYQIQDRAGHTKIFSDSIILDQTPPATPSIASSTHPDQNLEYSNDSTIFTWSSNDNLSGVNGFSYVLDESSQTIPDDVADTNGNEITFSGLLDGSYYFHLKAIDEAGNWSGVSHFRLNIDTTPPASPTSLVVTDTPSDEGFALDLSWTASIDTDVVGYLIFWGTSSQSYEDSITVDKDTFSYRLDGLSKNTRYYVALKAVDDAGNLSGFLIEAEATTQDNLAPQKPLNLTTVAGDTIINLSWQANIETDLAGYQIYWGSASREYQNSTTVGRVNNFTLHGLTNGKTYYIAISALDTSGNESKLSDEVSAIPFSSSGTISRGSKDKIPPELPTGFRYEWQEDGILLSWDKNQEDDLAGYNLYRASSGDEPSKINLDLIILESYLDSSVEQGVVYYYYVTTVDKAGNESSRAGPLTVKIPVPEPDFIDISEDFWARNYIIDLAQRGIINGYPDGTFRPARQITRAEFIKTLFLATGKQPTAFFKGYFPDVLVIHWAWAYIEKAKELGLISGYADGSFRPNQYITRAEVAKIIALTGNYSLGVSGKSFQDVSESYWAYQYIEAIKRNGIINGYPDGTFRPENYTTRAESAKILYQLH
jgi:fibronectin type 3 domain-containing protein